LAKQQLREPRQPKELHIAAPATLLSVALHRLAPNEGMRGIQDRELLEALGVAGCNPPTHRPTPVVSDNRESMVPEMIDKTDDIGCSDLLKGGDGRLVPLSDAGRGVGLSTDWHNC
jgi:hypothetical protein